MNTADILGNEPILLDDDTSGRVDLAICQEPSHTDGYSCVDPIILRTNGVDGDGQETLLNPEVLEKPPLASDQCTHGGEKKGTGLPAEVSDSLLSETIAVRGEGEETDMGDNDLPSLTGVPCSQATDGTDSKVPGNTARDVPEELGSSEEDDGEEEVGEGGVRDEGMKEAETDSDPYVSDSSEASSESESEEEPLEDVIAKVMQSKGAGGGSDDEDATEPPRTKHEVTVSDFVPCNIRMYWTRAVRNW